MGTVGEHSSFDELQALVRDIRPRRLVPTVNSESSAAKARFELEAVTHQALRTSDMACTSYIADDIIADDTYIYIHIKYVHIRVLFGGYLAPQKPAGLFSLNLR